MRILSTLLSILLLFSALAGCKAAKTEGEARYLVLWPTANGEYKLQEISLTTLSSAYEMKGEAAEIYYENALSGEGFKGSVAKPHLTRQGDVYIPMDVESAMAVTAYAHFEKLYLYEKQLGIASQLSWPRKVGVQIRMGDEAASTHNNAHYFASSDSIALLPFSLDTGVPMGMNLGVTAHEHFHAHFQKMVIEPLNKLLMEKGIGQNADRVSGLDLSEAVSRNNIVLRGWNEGLADFFASTYSGAPDFFRPSLPAISADRDLRGKLAPFTTGDELFSFVKKPEVNDKSVLSKSYSEGTILARLLFRAVHSRSEDPRAFQVRLMSRLNNLPPVLAEQYGAALSFDDIVPVLLEGEELNSTICQDLNQTLRVETLKERFPSCD